MTKTLTYKLPEERSAALQHLKDRKIEMKHCIKETEVKINTLIKEIQDIDNAIYILQE